MEQSQKEESSIYLRTTLSLPSLYLCLVQGMNPLKMLHKKIQGVIKRNSQKLKKENKGTSIHQYWQSANIWEPIIQRWDQE